MRQAVEELWPEIGWIRDANLRESVLQTWLRAFESSPLTPDDLQARCMTVGGIEMRVWKWLRLMIEHQIHHRGQLYETLGRLGVATPPLYGLTEPEVKARSE